MKLPIIFRPHVELAEVHQYVQDLQQVTLLRDKSMEGAERERYNVVLANMQRVLLHLNRIREERIKE